MTVDPAMPVLQTRGLQRRYGATPVLRGLDLAVRPGEVYGFLGRNGAGKSTTIRILMGLMRPDAGDAELFGLSLAKHAVALRARVGYVAQEPTFYPWMTVAQLGAFVGRFYPTWDRAEFERLRSDLLLPPERRVGALSGGMKRKLALALALAHRPPLLILDEPTAGLDPVARREFLERVRMDAEQTGRTTFFSTHLIDEIELIADRVGIVDEGQTRFEESVDTLAARIRALHLPPPVDLPVQAPPPESLTPENPTPERPTPESPTPESPTPENLPPESLPLDPLPEGLRVLDDRVFRGTRRVIVEGLVPGAFAPLEARLDRPLERLDLEEIFIAMVRR